MGLTGLFALHPSTMFSPEEDRDHGLRGHPHSRSMASSAMVSQTVTHEQINQVTRTRRFFWSNLIKCNVQSSSSRIGLLQSCLGSSDTMLETNFMSHLQQKTGQVLSMAKSHYHRPAQTSVLQHDGLSIHSVLIRLIRV